MVMPANLTSRWMKCAFPPSTPKNASVKMCESHAQSLDHQVAIDARAGHDMRAGHDI